VTCWISTLPWGQFCYLYVVPTRAKAIRMFNIEPPMVSVALPICRSSACKKQCKSWRSALPWGQFFYPYVAPMRINSDTKNNTNVEYRPSHGVSFVTHMLFQCVQKTMQMFNVDPPMGSVLLLICRSSACRKQCKCWILTLPRGQCCYPYVIPMRVKSNTNVECRIKNKTHVENQSSHGASFVTHVSFQCV